MPGFDRSGPVGAGPMTGGRRGMCGSSGSAPAYGGGYGRGRKRGACRSFGRGQGWGAGPAAYPTMGSTDEKELLQADAEAMRQSLEAVQKRIAELEKGGDK